MFGIKSGAWLAAVLLYASVHAADAEPIAAPAAFRFGGGEKIRLIVVPETISQPFEQLVSPDGFIQLPTGGDPLNIKGKTLPEAQKLAAARIASDSGILKSTAGIALVTVPNLYVYVGGEGIKLSQPIPYTGTNPMTLYASILAAGGISSDGDSTHVSLSRTNPDGSVKNQVFNVSNFGEPGSRTLGPILQAGDVVIVPRGPMIVLAGEVLRPGPLNRRELSINPDRPLRVSTAIYLAGGLRTGANRKGVQVFRNMNGRQVTITVDLDAAEKNNAKPTAAAGNDPKLNAPPTPTTPANPLSALNQVAEADPVLEDGDVVLVGATGGIPVLGKVRLPSVYPLNGQSIKLSRVLAQAGGFADFAKQSEVIIVKANNPNNPIKIDMSKMQRGGFQDVDLEEGDLVFVPERLL